MPIYHAVVTCRTSYACDEGYLSLETFGLVCWCFVKRRLHGTEERFERGRRYPGKSIRRAGVEDRGREYFSVAAAGASAGDCL